MHSILRSFATSVLAFGIVLCLAGCGNGGGRTTSNGQSNGNAGNSGNSGNSGNAGNTGNTAQPFTITKATTVNLPGAPTTAISDPGTGHAYVTTHSKDAQGNGTGAVVAINVASATIAATIPAPVGVPFNMAVNTRTHRLYVAFSAVTDAIGVIDTTTNTLIKTIPLKQNEESLNLAVDRATNRIYSASNTIGATPSVTIIDGATNMVVADAPIPQPGLLITVSQSTHRVFVMAQNFSTPDATPVKIYELAGDTGQLLSTNQFAGVPIGIVADPQSNQVLFSIAPDYNSGGNLKSLTPDRHFHRDLTATITLPQGYKVDHLFIVARGYFYVTPEALAKASQLYVDARDANDKKHLLIYSIPDYQLTNDIPYQAEAEADWSGSVWWDDFKDDLYLLSGLSGKDAQWVVQLPDSTPNSPAASQAAIVQITVH